MIRAVVFAFALLACKDKTEPPPGPPNATALAKMTDDEVVDLALKSMADIARLAKQHAADCETLAKALADHAAKHKDLINAFKKLSGDEVKGKDIASRHGGRILAIGQDTVKALQANCADHPAVRQLFTTLNQ